MQSNPLFRTRGAACGAVAFGCVRGNNVGVPISDDTSARRPSIVFFGHFDPEGGRCWVLRSGLEEHGFSVTLCRTVATGYGAKLRDLWRCWRSLPEKPSVLFVPFLGHGYLPLAWLLARWRGIPLVFDAFLSLYDTKVCDRRMRAPWHPEAWFLWLVDALCCRLCDVCLLDTEEHVQYFRSCFGANPRRLRAVPIGCRIDLFTPRSVAPSPQWTVAFHGTFIPLQGIETIVGAAEILQHRHADVHFMLIGRGQTSTAMEEMARRLALRNVTFAGGVPMDTLPDRLAAAQVCLGIFGTTDKAARVIPNKAYEVLAIGKPLVTADTPAARRVLRDGQHALLVPPGDSAALADALLRLKNDPDLCDRIAAEGHALSLRCFQPSTIVAPLARHLAALLSSVSNNT